MAGADETSFMEELSAKRRVVRKDAAGGACGSGRQAPTEIDELQLLNIVIQKEAEGPCSPSSAINARLTSIMVGGDDAPKSARLQRVPSTLAEVEGNKKYYTPMAVSIGPLHHHGNEKLVENEALKRRMTRQFVVDSQLPIKCLYKRVEDMAAGAREWYEEPETAKYGDKEFALMMFVDGCFVLQFIEMSLEEKKRQELKMKSHDMAYIRQDLFLLENQLPFAVLKALMPFIWCNPQTGMDKLCRFIRNYYKVEGSKREPLHLLELLRTSLLGEGPMKLTAPKEGETKPFRSATELKAKGIHFKPSGSACLRDIYFKTTCFHAELFLPKITVDDSTKSMYLNLIAYEMCPDVPDDSGVTSYIVFMDSLIDQAKDVEELRRRILHNYLGSDDDVAKLFNEISADLVPNMDIYDRVSQHIGNYTKNRWNPWMAQMWHDHFSSPWTIIAFLGALFAILLTAAQTYLAIAPPPDKCMQSICTHLKHFHR